MGGMGGSRGLRGDGNGIRPGQPDGDRSGGERQGDCLGGGIVRGGQPPGAMEEFLELVEVG